jgi:hypothetical protein
LLAFPSPSSLLFREKAIIVNSWAARYRLTGLRLNLTHRPA